MASSKKDSSSITPREVPGSYGFPLLGNLRDRMDFYYRQGHEKYFVSRIEKYGSTVVRINVPRGPFMVLDPRVVALLDAKSFPVLFDPSKVEKRNTLGGTYVASTTLTGGHRVCAYLDPSEPAHAKAKQMLLSLLHSRRDAFIPAFRSNFSSLLSVVEMQLKVGEGKPVDFNKLNDVVVYDFLGEAYFGARPSAFTPDLASKAGKWLLVQLCPLATLGLPMLIEEPLLHSVPLPPVLVRGDYKALHAYFSAAGATAIDEGEKLGLSREEACNNLIFATTFNSYGAMKLLLPGILTCISGDEELHKKLASEIRAAVAGAGGQVTLAALERMELTKSVVWEALRLDPPVKFQYGRAKADMLIESHDAVYEVKKGELLLGYQPCATRDARVFGDTAGKFVADRFVGEDGRKLLRYVYWSNGRETEDPTVDNKQCPGKDLGVLVGRMFLVELFLRYDTFTVKVTNGPLGTNVAFTSVTKAAAA
ncbi:hypothetical protein QOZ80_9AG0676700 [Eleusine coracana subsp. coracana]|nr:hypothetical protein QOZ80_9AG0676700 [Eleusine coracana subsp. coracana]